MPARNVTPPQNPMEPFWDRTIETKPILLDLMQNFLREVRKQGVSNVSINEVAETHLEDANKSKNFHKYFRKNDVAPLNSVALMFLFYRYYWKPLNEKLQSFLEHTRHYLKEETREREIVLQVVKLLYKSRLDDLETPIDEAELFEVLCREVLNRDLFTLMHDPQNEPYHDFRKVLREELERGSEKQLFHLNLEPDLLSRILVFKIWSYLTMRQVDGIAEEQVPELIAMELTHHLGSTFTAEDLRVD